MSVGERRKSVRVRDVLDLLTRIMEAKDPYTSGHLVRVGYYSEKFGQYLGFSELDCERLKLAGVLHDIGKLGIPDTILKKPGKLTPEEFEEMRNHTWIGFEILKKFKPLESIALVACDHHLRPDGFGYPKKNNASERQYKRFEGVDIYTKIVIITDVFDVLWSGRSFSEKKALRWIIGEFEQHANKQFDADVVQGFCRFLQERYETIADGQKVAVIVEKEKKKAA